MVSRALEGSALVRGWRDLNVRIGWTSQEKIMIVDGSEE
jgi:hypothetical protein